MSCCDICDELAQIKAEQAWERQALTLLLQHAGLQVPGASPAFEVDAVRMETTDWISSATNWSDSPTGSMFLWAKFQPSNDASLVSIAGVASLLEIYPASGGGGQGYVFDSTQTNYAYVLPAAATFADSVWLPIFMDWKTDETAGNKILQVYLGDTSVGGTITDDGTASFSATWTGQTMYIGRQPSGTGMEFNGDMAEFWLSTTRLDFSVESNRRKFYSATGKPVDVGADGSTPTGSAPEVYLSVRPGDAAADFVTNRGTGNDFTQNGTLTLASTSPSD